MLKIAVLISGNGSNLQSIIDNIDNGYLDCSIEMVISDRHGAYGLERAKQRKIKTYTLDRRNLTGSISDEILNMTYERVDLIVLAGFLSILEGDILKKFKNKIINIHPSLIPSFCGKGMYGIKVHQNVIEYGVKFSGCTVHLVDGGTDSGAIICQKVVPVYNCDTPETLQQRVLEQEHVALCQVLRMISTSHMMVNERKVDFIQGGFC